MVRKVRFGIIGSAGLIGSYHASVLSRGQGPYELAALCDAHPQRLAEQSDRLKVAATTKVEELLSRSDMDAVIVATPHRLHARQVIAVVESGRDVITEKPLASTPADARAMLRAINRTRRIAGIHYQSRGRPGVIKAKEMIASGQLGRLLSIRVTGSYYKSDYYYTLGGWRGTWRDEGGGVLINQAPHDIDLMCYLAAEAAPVELIGRWTNLYHQNSQTEDSATAAGRFPNGVEFSLQVSVATHGDPARIEVFGTAGTITLVNEACARFALYEQGVIEFARAYDGPDPYAAPAVRAQPLPEVGPEDPDLLHKRFAEAVLTRDRSKLLVSAAQGIWSAETIYGVLLSGYLGKAVKLPVSQARYEKMLADLIAKAKPLTRARREPPIGLAAH